MAGGISEAAAAEADTGGCKRSGEVLEALKVLGEEEERRGEHAAALSLQ